MNGKRLWIAGMMLLMLWGRPAGAQTALNIGTVQGVNESSPFEGESVTIQGVVTGRYRSQNSQGRIFHTLFVQEAVGTGDNNPLTSDAIPVFVGENEVAIKAGDIIRVSGRVKEFFGLTELISSAAQITILAREQTLPEPVPWPFPEDIESVEALEGMLVEYGPAVVAGPTHAGCGFALLPANSPHSHSHRHNVETFDGNLLTVQYGDELNCDQLPALKVGDTVPTLVGPLNYNFDTWRLLLPVDEPIGFLATDLVSPHPFLLPDDRTIRLVSLNLHNYFDEQRDSDHEAEPLIPVEQQLLRRQKITAVVSQLLDCPGMIAVQEVEKRRLLEELARALAPACGFTYGVAHEPSVDARGIDVALLYNPDLVRIEGVTSKQGCSQVPTAVVHEGFACADAENPLFSRPPLFVHLQADGEPLLLIVVHLKSKRGGAVETEPIRMAQAEALLAWRAEANRPVIIIGDVNDYRDSAPLTRLTSTDLFNVLTRLPEEDQYTFIFDGYAQLLDAILISPELQPFVRHQAILHSNADFPARWETATSPEQLLFSISDHDIPIMDLRWSQTVTVTPVNSETAARPENNRAIVTVDSEVDFVTPTEEFQVVETPQLTPVTTPESKVESASSATLTSWEQLLLGVAITFSAMLILILGKKALLS